MTNQVQNPSRLRHPKAAPIFSPYNDLHMVQKKLALSGFLTRFAKLNLLVIDELGFLAVDKAAAQLLLQLISDLSEHVSVIVTSHLRLSDWKTIFADEHIPTAFLDRFTQRKDLGVCRRFIPLSPPPPTR